LEECGAYQEAANCFSLAEIAYRQKAAPTAIRNHLAKAPPDAEEAKLVISRLKELQLDQR
jgi:hypothetical protein